MLISAILVACTAPGPRLDERAQRLGLTRQILLGTDYKHIVYQNGVKESVFHRGVLHVYLDGDGTPWLDRFTVASDPTPRNLLVLKLMSQDNAPSIYLGRPCYHGQATVPPCNPLLWTSRRYGPEVVDSMEAALKSFLDRTHYDQLVFIGYSGGGALAMLLAERFRQTHMVLTIAGNLDPDRWTAWHGYSPLVGSLNPAARSPLPPNIVQMHLIGGRDKNIPAHLLDAVERGQKCARLILIPEFNHVCCWETIWPSILNELESKLKDLDSRDSDKCNVSPGTVDGSAGNPYPKF